MRYKNPLVDEIKSHSIDSSNIYLNSTDLLDEETSIDNLKLDYLLLKSQINPKEVNNCVVDTYLISKYKLEIINSKIKNQQLKKIFRNKLIYEIISDMINEPLFDKIRTVDKLGYIVKSVLKYHTDFNNCLLFLCYMVQSNYSVKDIYKSINDFNVIFYKDFNENKDKFEKMFETLKKSKILELGKNPTDLDEEASIYLNTIINKYGIFNYDKLNMQILETITFLELTESMDTFFNDIVKTNRHHVILDKNIE
jgi:insulysin